MVFDRHCPAVASTRYLGCIAPLNHKKKRRALPAALDQSVFLTRSFLMVLGWTEVTISLPSLANSAHDVVSREVRVDTSDI